MKNRIITTYSVKLEESESTSIMEFSILLKIRKYKKRLIVLRIANQRFFMISQKTFNGQCSFDQYNSANRKNVIK